MEIDIDSWDIYVQSCGVSQEHDYHWQKITQDEDEHISKNPPILTEPIGTKTGKQVPITDKYDSQEPSIVVALVRGELLLLLTALEAIERTKYYGRQVRNSVALVSKYSEENEKVVRKTAAHAKDNWDAVKSAIDNAVYFDDTHGFRVKRELIEQYVKDVKNQVVPGDEPSSNIKINEVWEGISKNNLEENNQKKTKNHLIIAILLLTIMIVVVLLAMQMIPSMKRQKPVSHQTNTHTQTPLKEEIPTPTPSPTQQSQHPQTSQPSPADSLTRFPTPPPTFSNKSATSSPDKSQTQPTLSRNTQTRIITETPSSEERERLTKVMRERSNIHDNKDHK